MNKTYISKIGFDHIDSVKEVTYNDGDIAFLSDIRDLPLSELPVSLEMFIVVICEHGKLQIEINYDTYTITEKMILAYKPNELISSCMMSMDFKGNMLCFSNRIVLDSFSDSDFWDRGLAFSNNRTIKIDDDMIRIYNLYGELLQQRIGRQETLFKKEVVYSLVKAAIYDLLSYFKADVPEYGKGLLKQREVLFQRFIRLISGLHVKPRNVSWYADQLHITPKHLATVCKQTSGKTAFEWINEYVHTDIRNVLRNSNKSIKEVADYLKFPTISFFGKYVKAHTGLSPTEYRKKLREQNTEDMPD